jgi:predicted dehydrogenase
MADARRMRAAHHRAGTFVQVGQCVRFWPEYQAFEKFVRAGTAGRLLSLTMQRRSARPQYTVGHWINDAGRSLGAALDLHIHDTDYVLHLLGVPRAVRSRGVEDHEGWNHIFTDYVYEDTVVQAEGGWNYPAKWGFQMAFQAVFERGTVEYDSAASPTLKATLGESESFALPFVPAGGTAAAGGNISSLGGYANELRYFIDCVHAGRAPAIATLDQAITSLEVVLAEIKSAASGRPVVLKGARA